ncbi:MAG: FAD:protein FMN transferase [Chloroflexi bacterium]|nr:FAD:protein FMN transferase [Chloroflexota bacterium]
MRATADIMGMPISLHIVNAGAGQADADAVFAYLRHVDGVFSTYKSESETERINRGELSEHDCSEEMRLIIALCEQTRTETGGYFDARYRGRFDPSGVVKGYAIQRSAELLHERGFRDFFVEAGGDIQTSGRNDRGEKWRVGIRSPFNPSELINVVRLSGEGIATSGTYERGEHIYDPVLGCPANALAGVSVIAANVCDADRFATAAFAMGERGIHFLEAMPGLEGYVITRDQRAYCTTGLQRYMSQ